MQVCLFIFSRLKGEKDMLTRQKIEVLDKKKKLIRIRNTFDIGQAIEAAQEATEHGGRVGNGSSEVIQMGFIPEEMWLYDPWLMEANKARNHGDMGAYHKMLVKFFEVHPEFTPLHTRKYWQGAR